MTFHAWFECFAGCGVRYDLTQIVYRCEACGGLLDEIDACLGQTGNYLCRSLRVTVSLIRIEAQRHT